MSSEDPWVEYVRGKIFCCSCGSHRRSHGKYHEKSQYWFESCKQAYSLESVRPQELFDLSISVRYIAAHRRPEGIGIWLLEYEDDLCIEHSFSSLLY